MWIIIRSLRTQGWTNIRVLMDGFKGMVDIFLVEELMMMKNK